jgi:hypothetical protein
VWAAISVQQAQAIMDAVRTAYRALPDAMLVAGVELNPLEVTAVNGLTSEYFRVPVTVNDDGTFSFGAAIPTTGPGGQSYPDPPGTVRPNTPGGSPTLPAPKYGPKQPGNKTGAAAAPADRDYAALFGPGTPDNTPAPEYDKLFTSREAAERALDKQEADARHAIASMTDDALYQKLFGNGGAR